MQEWLAAQGVPEADIAGKLKPDLLKMSKKMKVAERLAIEEALVGTRHVILWLPPTIACTIPLNLYVGCPSVNISFFDDLQPPFP